jgi:hypothetical protein
VRPGDSKLPDVTDSLAGGLAILVKLLDGSPNV